MAKHICEIISRYGNTPHVIEFQIVESDKLAIQIERDINKLLSEKTHSKEGPETVVRCTAIDLINHTTYKAFKDRAIDIEKDLTLIDND